jgi:hypothetical protein
LDWACCGPPGDRRTTGAAGTEGAGRLRRHRGLEAGAVRPGQRFAAAGQRRRRWRALCLDYDFHKVSGYVGIRRALNIEYPVNYRFGFQLRGDSPANDLQFKPTTPAATTSGGSTARATASQWTPVEYRRRQIDKAWGPSPEKEMARSAAVEFTIYSKVGGRGTVCFDKLTLQGLPPQDDSALVPSVIADTATALQDRMIDGKSDTFWISGGVKQQTISLDLHKSREIGGAVIDWLPNLEARRYTVRTSEDGRDWRTVREVTRGAGGRDWLALPDTDARYVRFDLQDGPNWRYGIRDIIKPLASPPRAERLPVLGGRRPAARLAAACLCGRTAVLDPARPSMAARNRR